MGLGIYAEDFVDLGEGQKKWKPINEDGLLLQVGNRAYIVLREGIAAFKRSMQAHGLHASQGEAFGEAGFLLWVDRGTKSRPLSRIVCETGKAGVDRLGE